LAVKAQQRSTLDLRLPANLVARLRILRAGLFGYHQAARV